MTDILELARRVEALDGPCREVDLLIMRYVENIGGPASNALRYTASLDAAMTLLGKHDFWRVGHDGEGQDPSAFKAQVGVEREGTCCPAFATSIAASAPLAFTAAALRAIRETK